MMKLQPARRFTFFFFCVALFLFFGFDYAWAQCSITRTLSGNLAPCGQAVYTTEAGMSNYLWTVSSGGTITGGGNSNSVTIIWGAVTTQSLSVSYLDGNNCTSSSPVVSINPTTSTAPVTGPATSCVNSTGTYSTTYVGSGPLAIAWSLLPPSAGTLGTNYSSQISVTWLQAGQQTIQFAGIDPTGCRISGSQIVTVSAAPVVQLTGPTAVCTGQTTATYTTDAGMSVYNWQVTGGSITNGSGTNSIIVAWGSNGGTLSISYKTPGGCTGTNSIPYISILQPFVSGPAVVCPNSTGLQYSTATGKSNYAWNITGGQIVAGSGTNVVTVNWNASPQNISVTFLDSTDPNNPCTPPPAVETVSTPSSTPTLIGPETICATNVAQYVTEQGMTNYNWNVSSGGTIIINSLLGPGGGQPNPLTAYPVPPSSLASLSSITVYWGVASGPQSVSVSYTNCSGAVVSPPTLPVVDNVTTGTISGATNVCFGSTIAYSSGPGSSDSYYATGGELHYAGNSAVVIWNQAGATTGQVAFDYYNSATGCRSEAIENITIKAPAPLVSTSTVCVGIPATFSAITGQSSYTWNPGSGGTVQSGQGTSNATILWNSSGQRTVTVSYLDAAYGCILTSTLSVIVGSIPAPYLPYAYPVCQGALANYVTGSGFTSYNWTIPGGTITQGANTNSVWVRWNASGAQTVSVGATNSYGCSSTSPFVLNVTVNPAPVPDFTANPTGCYNSNSAFQTDIHQTNYVWGVTGAGIVGNSNSPLSSDLVVLWTARGTQTVSLNYTDAYGCTGLTPTTKTVTITGPTPTITGNSTGCYNLPGETYSTEPGMGGYAWTIAGGVITAGAGTNTVTVTWNTPGTQQIKVNYSDAAGCAASTATIKSVNVNVLGAPTITGAASACVNSATSYTTEPGMSGYVWSAVGGSITGGQGSSAATVTWSSTGAQSVHVSYNCTASSTTKSVTINAQPLPTLVGGNPTVCVGSSVSYSTETGKTNYTWGTTGMVTAGGTPTSPTITVTWPVAGPGTISVNYTDANGCTAPAATVKSITVDSPVATITGTSTPCTNVYSIPYSTETGMSSYVWTITGGYITTGSGTANIQVTWLSGSSNSISVNYVRPSGCHATASKTATPTSPQTATLTGPSLFCGTGSGAYVTEAGQTGYTWSASGGTVTPNGNTATVVWTTSGNVTVTYTGSNGCPASASRTVTAGSPGCSEALNFNGTTYVNIPEINQRLNVNGGDFTLEVYMQATSSNGVASLISKRSTVSGSTADGYLFGLFGSTGPFLQLAGSPNIQPTCTFNLLDGQCHVVTVRRVASTGAISFFVDGVYKCDGNSTSKRSVYSPGGLQIARDVPAGAFYTGWIGEVRVWNTALSNSLISANANHNPSPPVANLMGYYDMKDPAGSQTLTDLSTPSGSNGILGSATVPDSSDPTWLNSTQISCTTNGGNFRQDLPSALNSMERIMQDSVREISENLKLYPNPTSKKLRVELFEAVKENTTISFIDLTGAQVKEVQLQAGESTLDIETESLLNGMYIMEVKLRQGFVRKKIIVLRN